MIRHTQGVNTQHTNNYETEGIKFKQKGLNYSGLYDTHKGLNNSGLYNTKGVHLTEIIYRTL